MPVRTLQLGSVAWNLWVRERKWIEPIPCLRPVSAFIMLSSVKGWCLSPPLMVTCALFFFFFSVEYRWHRSNGSYRVLSAFFVLSKVALIVPEKHGWPMKLMPCRSWKAHRR